MIHGTGLKRKCNEEFYTKREVSKKCIDVLSSYFDLDSFDTIIEPSAGDGSFCDFLNKDKLKSYDIEPKKDYIIKQDFLSLEIKRGNILCIGNPPFGRQSSMAKKFIKFSCLFSRVIAFILPKSFKKDSFQKTFDLTFHLIHQTDIPEKSFVFHDKEYDVPCVFQIWEKKNEKRKTKEKQKEKGFKFVKKEESPEVSFRRVGVNAGTFSSDTNKSEQSHYFLIFDTKQDIEKLNSIKWEFNNSVGPKSISKQELIEKLNMLN